MSGRRARLSIGLALLLAAAWAGQRGEPPSRLSAEPLARSLAPLGPVKAILSSALWYQLLRSEVEADSERFAWTARALLELHPGLDSVREHLAVQLVTSEARRAPDLERRAALVERGLILLDEGLELSHSRRLHLTMAELLMDRRRKDPLFALTVERALGDSPEELAIEHLLSARSEDPIHAAMLASLLVERGVRSLVVDGRVGAAKRDLAAALSSLTSVRASAPREAEQIVRPLRDLLHRVEQGANPRDLDPLRGAWQDGGEPES